MSDIEVWEPRPVRVPKASPAGWVVFGVFMFVTGWAFGLVLILLAAG